jgi:two-component system phosphate regulon sensor histidine kinase PhoR
MRFSCLLAGLSILLTAILIHVVFYFNLSERVRQEARAEAGYLRAGYELSGAAYLGSVRYTPDAGRVTLVAADGAVLFDSVANAETMENHLSRPEIRAALGGGAGEDTRLSGTIHKQSYYYAVRLADGSVLRVSSVSDSIFMFLANMLFWVAAAAVAAFAVAAAVGGRVTRRVVAPINQMNLDAPEENNAVYEELAPLLTRMKRQNDELARRVYETRQKQIEFSAITDNMREGLLVLDRDAHVLSYNKSAVELLRVHLSGDEKNRPAIAFNRSEGFRAAVKRALGGEAAEAVLPVEGRRLQLIASPVRDGGVIRGAVLMLLDVTEREDRERLRREFTANVSHELKTPLTVISGCAEIISNGLAKAADIPRFAGRIFDEAGRLIALVNDVMTLSKLDEAASGAEISPGPVSDVGSGAVSGVGPGFGSGPGPAPGEVVDLGALVRDALRRVAALAEQKGLALRLNGASIDAPGADGFMLTGVRRILDEMILNLLDNAIKYNIQGGAVDVALTNGDGALTLSVADTGIGVPPEEQERIFERFYQIDKSRNGGPARGTGLGLSIVKHGAILHKAAISVESDGVAGTKIILRFPN